MAMEYCFALLFTVASLAQIPPPHDATADARIDERYSKFVMYTLDEPKTIYALALSTDGKWLLSGGSEENADRTKCIIRKWNLSTKKNVNTFVNPDVAYVFDLAFSPNNENFAASTVNIVSIWGRDGLLGKFREFDNISTSCSLLFFIADDAVVWVSSRAIGHRYDIKSKELSNYFCTSEFSALAGAVNSSTTKLALYTGNEIIIASADLSIKYKYINTSSLPPVKAIMTMHMAMNSAGDRVFATGERGKRYLFDAKSGKLLKSWKDKNGTRICCVRSVPKKDLFMTGDDDGYITFWNNNGELVNRVRYYCAPINALAASADARILATAGDVQRIAIWDLEKLLKKKEK